MLMQEDKFKSTDKAKFEVTSEERVKTRTIYKALSEMEFLFGSFSRGFLCINLSLLSPDFFFWFSTLFFLFYKILFME